MIDVDDLMIGNYVVGADEVRTVDHILQDNRVGFVDHPFFLNNDEVFPIETAKPWLTKLGFEYSESLDAWALTLNDELYEVVFEHGYFWFTFANLNNETWQQMPKRKVEYVHQLQNIFYSVSRRKLKLI